MMKRIFDFIADIKLTFYLLIAVAAVMFAGSVYTGTYPDIFKTINSQAIQNWFLSDGIHNMSKTWWLPLLFVVFSLLWINLAACTAKRISVLWSRRKDLPLKQFVLFMVPSYVHLLFLVILAAHFMTFTLFEQRTIPVDEGTSVKLADGIELHVQEIHHEYFPEESILKNRIKQSTVMFDYIDNGRSTPCRAGFVDPACIDGNYILINMKKKNITDVPAVKTEQTGGKVKQPDAVKPAIESSQMYIVVTRDPGLLVLIVCFIQIIIAMGWYYFQLNRSGEVKG